MHTNGYWGALFCLLLLFSCKQEKEVHSIPVLNLTEVLDGNKTIEFSDFVANIEMIPLETNEDILIGRISKVILSSEHLIVVHDNQCSVFDLQGNFIRKISNRGQGPREYNYIVNTALIGDVIYIFDESKVLTFNVDGTFLSSNTLSRLDFVTVLDDHYIGYRANQSGSEKNKLFFFNRDWQPVDSIPNHTQYENQSGITSTFFNNEAQMYRYHGAVHLKELANDTLFAVSSDRKMTPLYVMDLGEYAPKEEERYQLYNAQQPLFKGKKLFTSIIETDAHLIMKVGVMEKNRHILYNKETGSLENVAFKYNDEYKRRFGNDFFNPKFVSEDNQVLITHELNADIDNDDNPVLVLVTLKK